MNTAFVKYSLSRKKEGTQRKMIISLVDKGTKMILEDYMPVAPYSNELGARMILEL
ncbi:MAG: hypothetical protein M1477_04945 [Candidatus Thermoplasmatota archaeon]|nr:hypothetical protein [Candidatus Thermoplasmatota archaeon]